ncbi:MAG: 50S ribosome-binding GTPase, partial [Caldilineaceae bacterium]|nr:50S ribosome-binding GTPase [Caldilineaceae bacterium]
LVGYTNAGKSTMLNALSKAGVLAEDQLFATLDPTTRRVELPSGQVIMLSDTVGFIQKLPTTLVAAFRATLEEVNNADILIHMVDASHPNMDEQIAAVEEVLEELGAGQKTVITALNKVDRIEQSDPEQAQRLAAAVAEYPNVVLCSALTGVGLHDLLSKIDDMLRQRMMQIEVLIPYAKSKLVANFYQYGLVDQEEHTETGTHLVGRLPVEIAGQLKEYWIDDGVADTVTG